MQTQSTASENLSLAGHLSPELAEVFLNGLPEHIWAVIEMAIAGYLDDEALSFVDCKPS
jgi:hypothetical protein